MNSENLRQIFKAPFDYKTYCNEIVHRLFGCNDVAIRPELLPTNSKGDQNYFIGQMDDTDGRLLGFFYTRLAEGSDVRRKRVGLRKLITPYVRYEVDAAIAVFDDGIRWRLSYICDMKEGTTTPKRFSYVLGDSDGQYNTPTHRLAKLSGKVRNLRIADIFEAFSVETLSKEFFDAYHIHYDRIVAELARQGKTGAVYDDYVKKLMGRIVFLHFLQKKGWLCGDTNFMLNTFSQSNRRSDYLESVLEPLFFGILNTEPAKREQVFSRNGWQQGLVEKWASIPYLNGGLFERDDVDNLRIVLPESIFSNLFSFLASYNFTVDENDPDDAEIGVDPEMLGKIFESLLEDNKAKGAFYTPKEIVRYMCKESLIAYLVSSVETRHGTSLQDDNKRKACVRAFVEQHEMQPELEPYRDTLSNALREVKICDPAIGSGAFPMGLLNELWRCREALGTQLSRLQLKKEIIENNIYGVDIERGAIDIARLRFWLSIVVDSEKAEPLPNFDYKFMQGNSLIESYQGCDLSRISGRTVGRPSTSTQLLIGLDSHLSRKNLQRLLRDYFSVTDHQQKATMRQAINDEVKTLIRESLGGTTATLTKLEKLDPSANQDFFLWHTWFKDIFDNGGFDIVIGNPPYISIQGMSVTERNIYKGLFKFFFHRYDIFGCFIERGISLLATNGILMLIQPSVFLNSKSFMKCREYIVQNTRILNLDLLKDGVFKSAVVPTMIMGLSNRKARNDNSIRCSKNGIGDFYPIKQSSFLTTEANVFNLDLDENTALFIKKTQENCVLLGDIARISRAFNVGDYERFLSDTYQDGFIKVLKGASISKWIYEYKGLFLKPDFGEFVSCGDIEVLNSPKLMMKRIGVYPNVCYDDSGIAGLDTIYTIRILSKDYSPLYVMGLLNSKLIGIIFRKRVPLKGNVFPEFRIFDLNKQIPIKKATASQQNPIISIVKQIVNIKQNDPLADVSSFEREIDQKVYELYDLSPEEIAVIIKN